VGVAGGGHGTKRVGDGVLLVVFNGQALALRPPLAGTKLKFTIPSVCCPPGSRSKTHKLESAPNFMPPGPAAAA